ncbi:MAG: MATE family efflux transporter [Devosia sp.]
MTVAAGREAGWLVTRAQTKRILAIGLPIVGGMLSQNVLDIVDTLMVGRLGAAALAAVGIASFANFLAVAVLVGLSAGVQAVVARRKGEGREEEMAIPLNGGLLFAVILGAVITIVGLMVAPTVYPVLVDHDPDIVAQGVPYFEARLLGSIAIGLNFSFRGFWYGIGETKTYLKIIITMHVVNVVVSYVLIFGPFGLPALGTLGAGIGTTFALYVGTVLYAVLTFRRARPMGFLKRLPRGATVRSLLRLSIPSAVQMLLFAAGLTALFTIAGLVGVAALAVSNVLVNVSKIAVLPAMGLGMAAMTLVSNALGRADPDEANRWAWQTVQLALVTVTAVACVLMAVPETILRIFTDDASVIAAGVLPIRIAGAALVIEAFAAVMGNALTGAGAARLTMAVNGLAQWALGLPLAYLLAVEFNHGVVGIWVGWSASRVVTALALTAFWMAGRWRSIKL